MTTQFKSVLHNYLENEYPFALMIDSPWGSGKTYYLLNQMKEDFTQLIKGKVIYTSANGIKSVDELRSQILYRKANVKEGKENSVAGRIASGLLSGMAGKIGVELKDLAYINGTDVLIIDDLERKHKSLTVEEILGFISINFTELNRLKVIIVADENKLISRLKKSGNAKEYEEVKEKTIWRTVEYKANTEEIYNSIITKFPEDLNQILKHHEINLLEEFDRLNITNLRTISFYFDCIKSIWIKSKACILQDDNNLVLRSLLILCQEAKSQGKRYSIDQVMPFFMRVSSRGMFKFKDKNSTKEPDGERWQRLYLDDVKVKYHPYQSLFKLVFHGWLDVKLLKEESNSFLTSITKPKPEEEALKKATQMPNINYDEFNENWGNVLKFVSEGKYDANRILGIAYFYHQRNDEGYPIPIERNKFYDILKKGIIANNEFDEDYYSPFHNNEDYYDNISEMKELKNVIGQAQKNNEQDRIKQNASIKVENYLKGQKERGMNAVYVSIFSTDEDLKRVLNHIISSEQEIHLYKHGISRDVRFLRSNITDNIERIDKIIQFFKDNEESNFIMKGTIKEIIEFLELEKRKHLDSER